MKDWVDKFTDSELGKIYRIQAYVQDFNKPITVDEITNVICLSRTSTKRLINKLIEYNVFNITK